MAEVGKRLQQLRQQKQLSQRQLELQAGIPAGIVSRLENGEQAYPSMPVAIRLAKVFGVSIDYLVGRYEDEHGDRL